MSWSSPLPPPTQCSSDHLHDNYPAKPLETVTPGWCSTSSAPPTYFTSFLNYSPDQDQGPTTERFKSPTETSQEKEISLLNIQSQLYENSFKQIVFDTHLYKSFFKFIDRILLLCSSTFILFAGPETLHGIWVTSYDNVWAGFSLFSDEMRWAADELLMVPELMSRVHPWLRPS